MRNLILFIWRNYFVFMFLSLETLAFYFILLNNKYQNTGFFNSSNAIAGNVYQTFNQFTDYVNLRDVNRSLAAEHAILRTFSENSFITIVNNKIEIKDTIHKQKYIYTNAKVINNSINKRNNYLTLNVGSLQGIAKDMGVIAPDGVVGIVKDVSENFSSVMSVLNKNTMISCKFKNTNYFGPLSWEGGDYTVAKLGDIAKHVRINVGDTIITSGASARFPDGIMVGTIKSFDLKEGNNFYDIEINLSTDFGKLSFVYVINNLMKEEQKKLEKTSQEN